MKAKKNRKRNGLAEEDIVPLPKKNKTTITGEECEFTGDPVPKLEAKDRWPHRYLNRAKEANAAEYNIEWNDPGILQASSHYNQALVDGNIINLFDNVYIQAEEGKPDYIAKIVEFFETIDKEQYLTARWFYRPTDSVIKDHAYLVDEKRVFYSNVKDDNPLGCIIKKVKIDINPLDVVTPKPDGYLFCNMRYHFPNLTFDNMVDALDDVQNHGSDSDTSSTISSDHSSNGVIDDISNIEKQALVKPILEMNLLDLYSGCGALSTGLCLGATLSRVKLVNRWAVDYNEHACKSLSKNHPETKVRNEKAEDFLALLKEWQKLCQEFLFSPTPLLGETNAEEQEDDEVPLSPGEFEVGKLLDICYGDPNHVRKRGLYFKVHWKGYDDPDEDTWEPIEGLSGSEERINEFVAEGYQKKLLPLPGDADFICGGPPCQGVSGFNRFRDKANPLNDSKNQQLLVFMDIVEFLKPKYVLMENVVDILKFANGFLGRYANGRLIGLNYQTRLGIMAAGSYGLPQFRMRVFLWGAHKSQKLPQFPLPTHDVVTRGGVPNEFADNYVTHGKKSSTKLDSALFLGDAISDLPPVRNDASEDQMAYVEAPQTEFQKYIRLPKKDMISFNGSPVLDDNEAIHELYDHLPLHLNNDDYQRVCQIPKQKGANFRNLPGVLVSANNKVSLDLSMKRVFLDSKKPLVPDYAISYVRGTSSKPFGRLWWDETVSTVVTRAEPHNQVILHPLQDRVLTVRENARLQGFLDCYKLCGPVKEKYIQVGNAVAIPVATALGYAFGMASQGLIDDRPLMTLPFKFPQCLAQEQN